MSFRVMLMVIVGTTLAITASLASATELVPTGINHRIVISGFEFVPSELTVSIGDTVTWVNKDIVPHNISTNTDQNALSPNLESGAEFVYQVSESLNYICGLHPSMKGKLIMKQQ